MILWICFIALIILLLALDLGVFHKDDHVFTFKEAMWWSAFWISLGLAFSIVVYFAYEQQWFGLESYLSGKEASVEYLSGYLLEKSLSMDNIFVIVLIFAKFRIPQNLQHRVLFWGILGAIVFRGIMILVGAQALKQFDWMFYVFGGLLIFLALKMLFTDDEDPDLENTRFVRLVTRFLPFTNKIEGHKFLVTVEGRRMFSRLMLVLLVIEFTDVIFAVDSIPAVFAITRETFIVFSSNIFAILGLRSLYFALADLVYRFEYLKYSLVIILAYVGVKMILIAAKVVHIPTWISLTVISVCLVGGVVISLAITADEEPEDEQHADSDSKEASESDNGSASSAK